MQVRGERQQLLVPVFFERSLLVVVLSMYFVLTNKMPRFGGRTSRISAINGMQLLCGTD